MNLPRTLLLGLLASTIYTPVWAQTAVQPPAPAAPQPQTSQAQPQPVEEDEEEGAGVAGDDGYAVEEVVVTAGRPRGSVIGDIPPIIQLNSRDIRAIGAGSLTELLEALAPQIGPGSGRQAGPPITLLNGRRISGFGEIRGIPPEAIERVDILPEEVALKYGYRADQRVVNIVLRQRFRATTVEAGGGFATAGGREQTEVDINVLRINRENRTIFDVEHRHSEPLLETERDIEQAVGGRFDLVGNVAGTRAGGEIDPALSALLGRAITITGVPVSGAAGRPTLADFAVTGGNLRTTDLRPFRTLLGGNDQLSLNATFSRPIFGDVSATINGRLDFSHGESLIGLPSGTFRVPSGSPFSPFASDVLLLRYANTLGPLTRESDGMTGHLGMAMNGAVSDWRWSLTANYDLSNNLTTTETGLDPAAIQVRLDARDPTLNPFGTLPNQLLSLRPRDRARSINSTANAELVVNNGSIIELPAGGLSTTVRGQLEARNIRRETLRGGVADDADLSRERGSVQVSVDLPVASRRREVLKPLGNLTFNANLEIDQLSDFGTLSSLGYGVNWSPIEKVTLTASFTEEEGAPSVQQLGDPVLSTPQSPVFDFVRGQTVEVTRIEGGNPGLTADSRSVARLGLTLRPFQQRDLTLNLNYNRSQTENPISSFPGVTAQIEAAFPERFTRDASGQLLSFDSRPVNFARNEREEVRYGFNYSKPLRRPGAAGGPGGQDGAGRRGGAGQPGAGRPDANQQPNAAQPATGQPGAPATAAFQALRESQASRTGAQGGAGQPGAQQPGGGQPGGGQNRAGGGGFGGQGGGRGGFGGGGGGFGGGGGEGRLQLALFHTVRLVDSTLIREGLPELDFLGGAAAGSRGGRPRHELELQAGVTRSGLGVRLEGTWAGETFVQGTERGGTTTSDLFFSDVSTLNLRLFADLGQQRRLVERYTWLRASRVTLAVNNLFDTFPEVRDETGATPVNYQPDRLDPLGRSVRITFRKLFIAARPRGGANRPQGARPPG